jgi:hypothetical protein
MSILCNQNVQTSQQSRSFDQRESHPKHEYAKRLSVSFDDTNIAIRNIEHSIVDENQKRLLSAHKSTKKRENGVRKIVPESKTANNAPGEHMMATVSKNPKMQAAKSGLKKVLPVSHKTDVLQLKTKQCQFDSMVHDCGSQEEMGQRRGCDRGLYVPVSMIIH